MQVSPYLSFKGDCEEAFKFYEQHLGAKIEAVFHYRDSPMSSTVGSDWQDKVMHGSIRIGEQVLMGADLSGESYQAPQGISLSLNMKSSDEAEALFSALRDGGQIVVPLEQTFWAERFGMLVDRFGIPWLLNCEGASRPA
jgi:PhnB protein